MTNGYKLRTGLNSTRDEKAETNLIEEVLVSNSSLVSGPPEASGVKFSWVEASLAQGFFCEASLLVLPSN